MRSPNTAVCRMFLLSLACTMALPLSAQTLRVRHDHDPWGGCEGELQITEDGIRYETDDAAHQRQWDWADIQGFDRRSPESFSLLTYEDLSWHLGLDRAFDFTVLPGETGLTDDLFTLIEERLSRPVTDRVPRQIESEYAIEVKHLHVFGGCEGTLTFGTHWIVYSSDNAEDARTWSRERSVLSVWSSNPYELELRVLEENAKAFDKTARFRFQLKEPLDRNYYERLRREFLLAR